ncbi:MAG: zinc ribbon domain-containing protein [Candidatus Bathyarchaeota archaeon]|nr:zinc ribbon domain-containing protein [Candidatus Bathyarchaeota archaeon]
MNALVNGDFFDGSPEYIVIWLLLGILFGLPLYFAQNKSRKNNEGDEKLTRSRETESPEVSYQSETTIECSNLKCKALNPSGSKFCWNCGASLDLVIIGNQLDSSLKKLNNDKQSTMRMLDDIDKSLVQGNISESMYKDLKSKYEKRIKQIEKEILETKKNFEALEKERL